MATVLMMHFNGDDASTTFDDSCSANHTMTAVNDAQMDTAQSVFGGASGYFSGTDDYVQADDSADWDATGGDYTVDFWVRVDAWVGTFSALVGQCLGSDSWFIYVYNNGKIAVGVYGATEIGSATGIISLDTWYHIAVTRIHSTSTTNIYVNGYCRATGTSAVWNASANVLRIGATGTANELNGWIDELRMIKGTAVWTGSTVGTKYFDTPTAEYTDEGAEASSSHSSSSHSSSSHSSSSRSSSHSSSSQSSSRSSSSSSRSSSSSS
jgi:hypothetical protein